MKILTFSNYYPSHPGGIEIVAQNLVSRWRKNHQVRWAACVTSSNAYACGVDDIPLSACNFTEEKFGFPYPIPTLKSMQTIFTQVRWCDIIHIHDCLYLSNITAFLASRLFSKPLMVTQHIGIVPYSEKYKVALQKFAYHTIGRLILEQSDEVVFISKNVKLWFETKMNLPKTSLIQNGIDHQIFYPQNNGERRSIRAKLGFSENDIVLLFIGRFTQKKGLKIIHEIAQTRPNYRWLLLGEGEIDVIKWDLPNIKVFPPQPQEDLRKFYIAANMLVLPSRGEGFPLVVQEALSCGLPAAVSEEIAMVLPDAPLISLDISLTSNLVNALDKAIFTPKYLTLVSNKSAYYAKSWNWDDIGLQYEDHLIRLVSDAKGASQHINN